MGLFTSKTKADKDDAIIVDIDKIVSQYLLEDSMKGRIRPRTTWRDCFLRRKSNYYVDIDWKYAKIEHTVTSNDEPTTVKQPQPMSLFETTFRNDTNREREYCFRAERTTSSTYEVSVFKGWKLDAEIGGETKIGLSSLFPGGELNTSMKLTFGKEKSTTKREAMEESVTWGIEQPVKVDKFTALRGKLTVTEETLFRNFSVESSISLPNSKLPYRICWKRNGKTAFTSQMNCLDLMCYEDGGGKKLKYQQLRPGARKTEVTLTTEGCVYAIAAKRQVVNLTNEPTKQE